MYGNIFDIKRYAIHDGQGIRTTVFFKGCSLRCHWCHNPESQSFDFNTMEQTLRMGGREFKENKIVGYRTTPAELLAELLKDYVFFEESGGGVTFSGGEPLMQPDFLLECLKLCKANRIQTCVDTAGVAPAECLDEICRYTDTFLYDIKTADPDKFARYVGEGYSLVWEHLRRIVENGNEIILRIPIIPGVNDTREELLKIIALLQSVPSLRRVNLLPFHRTGSDKYKRLGMTYDMGGVQGLTDADLTEFKALFTQYNYLLK